jgi:hypothetical protein
MMAATNPPAFTKSTSTTSTQNAAVQDFRPSGSLAASSLCKSLLDFSAARGDNPSILGVRNLEAERGVRPKKNTRLFIKLGKGPNGAPALHYHRKKDYTRAEYHALKDQIKVDQTYYIGYKFSLGAIEQSMMLWQL